jgi:hypothetical protein
MVRAPSRMFDPMVLPTSRRTLLDARGRHPARWPVANSGFPPKHPSQERSTSAAVPRGTDGRRRRA